MKRVFSIMLVIAMVCAMGLVASGCKSSSGSTDTGKNDKNKVIPGGTADVSEEVLEALTKSGNITLYDWGELEGESAKWEEAFREYYSEIYGGTYEKVIIPWENWEDKYLTDFAAGDAPDLIYLFEKNWPKLANRGIVYSNEELAEMGVVGFDHPLLMSDRDFVETYYTYKGKLYVFATNTAEADMLFVDEDIFKNKGLKTPGEYYAEGLWNWETFVQCCVDVTEDTNGDGVTDMFGFGGWDGNFIVTAAGGELVKLKEDGTLVCGLEDTTTIQGLENYRDIYGVKKVALSSGTTLGVDVAMKAWMPSNEWPYISGGEYKFNWTMIPFPLDERTNKTGLRSGKNSGWTVSTSCENPQGCLNYMIARRAYANMYEHPTHKDYTKVFTDEQIEMMHDCTRKSNVPIFQGVGTLWHSQWDFWTALRGGKREVSEVVGTYRSLFEAQVALENSSATK